MSVTPIKLKSISELIADGEREDAERMERMKLDPRDPNHPTGTRWDKEHGYIDVYWGGYEYSINLNQIPTVRKLCEWVVHLGGKGETWNGMTRERIVDFIQLVFHAKGWNLWGEGPSSRKTSADEERAKLTPQMRWEVLKRDGFRCRACGTGPEHGAVLHMDHITPIAKGGTTELTNLQTLCACCNFGKRTT